MKTVPEAKRNVTSAAALEKLQEVSEMTINRRDRRKQEIYHRIYVAAIELLCERDFDAVTVEMITEAADVGKGTFFNHFASKEEVIAAHFQETRNLLIHALESPTPDIQERIDPEAYEHGVEPGPIWKRFVGTTYFAAARDGRNRRLVRTLLSLSISNEKVRLASLSMKAQLVELIVAYMREGQKTGEFRLDFSPEQLAAFTRNLYFSTQLAWAQSDDDSQFVDYVAPIIAMAWYAVRRQPPFSPSSVAPFTASSESK